MAVRQGNEVAYLIPMLVVGTRNPGYATSVRPLFSFCCEGTIVSTVNENAPTQFAIAFYDAPASATGVIVIVVSLPREFD